jgi:SAM-dependent methyltransferase
MRVDFRSPEEFTSWIGEHRGRFEGWRTAILADIARHGIIEPVSEARYPPSAVAIDPLNLRESVSAAGITSRNRAGLFALQLAHRRLPAPRRQRAAILGAEAVSGAARILRGAFSHFLGAEYLPTDADRKEHYPIPHLDLMNAGFPDAAFDLFYSGDALEHAPDIGRALAEIARILRFDGIMVTGFPFAAQSAAIRQPASLDAPERLVSDRPLEPRSNPGGRQEGSAVFDLPGWYILDSARKAGFADAKVTMLLSSTFGIVSAPLPGVLVMSAAKKDVKNTPAMVGGFTYCGPRLRRVIGLVGLARSGTTLLSSILGVHSAIAAVYEPFNANKKRALPPRIGIGEFFDAFPTPMQGKEILLVKETGTEIAFLDRVAELLRSAAPPVGTDLILLLRNPLHAYLSMLEAHKRWWGGAHEITAETFRAWARHNLLALARLLDMGREFNALIVSYEALVAAKERLVPEIMRQLGPEFEERQLSFEKYVDKRQVRGDITIATAPFAISNERVVQRGEELTAVRQHLAETPAYSRVSEIADLISTFANTGIARFDSPAGQLLVRAMRGASVRV